MKKTLEKVVNLGVVKAKSSRFELYYYSNIVGGERIHPVCVRHLLENKYIEKRFTRGDSEYFRISKLGTKKFQSK